MSTVIDLWKRLRPGVGFEQLLGPHVPRLYRLAHRLSGNADDAEDLVQETLMRAYRYQQRLRELDAPGPWLEKMLHNLWVDRWRRQGVMRDTTSLDQPDAPSLSDHGAAHDRLTGGLHLQELNQAILRLPEAQQLVILLHDAEGYTLEEMASSLEVPVGTLKSRLHRARLAVREMLRDGTFSVADTC